MNSMTAEINAWCADADNHSINIAAEVLPRWRGLDARSQALVNNWISRRLYPMLPAFIEIVALAEADIREHGVGPLSPCPKFWAAIQGGSYPAPAVNTARDLWPAGPGDAYRVRLALLDLWRAPTSETREEYRRAAWRAIGACIDAITDGTLDTELPVTEWPDFGWPA